MAAQPPTPQNVRASLIHVTHLIYALHASAVVVGLLSSATVAGGLVFGLPSLAAVVLNYWMAGEVRGTWLEAHFRWQIRTFWFGMLWGVLGAITFFLVIGWFVLIANVIWVIYRIAKGWLRLNDNKPMYVS